MRSLPFFFFFFKAGFGHGLDISLAGSDRKNGAELPSRDGGNNPILLIQDSLPEPRPPRLQVGMTQQHCKSRLEIPSRLPAGRSERSDRVWGCHGPRLSVQKFNVFTHGSQSTPRSKLEASPPSALRHDNGEKTPRKQQPRLCSIPLPGRGTAHSLDTGSLGLCRQRRLRFIANNWENARFSHGSCLFLQNGETRTDGTVGPCRQFPLC